MKNLKVSSIVGCVADKQGLLLMANLLQDGELLYHVDKEVCEVDRFTSARTSFTSQSTDPLKIVHIRLHKLLQSVAEVCYNISQQWETDQEKTFRVLVDGALHFFFCTHLLVVNWLHVWTRYWNVLHHFIGDQLPLKIPELSSLS